MIKKMHLVFTIAALLTALACVDGHIVIAGDWQGEFNIGSRKLSHTGKSKYFNLMPGFQTVLESPEEKITITVLDETRKINGIITRVVEERELKNGKVAEISRNFFAMDPKTGDVFYFGEEVDDYEKGKIVSHSGSWKAFEKGNKPGLIIPGNPKVGMKYYQEQAPGVAMDRAEVVSISETVRTPAGEFKNCLKLRETSKMEEGAEEYKIFAPGIGLVHKEDMKLISHGYEKGKSAPKRK